MCIRDRLYSFQSADMTSQNGRDDVIMSQPSLQLHNQPSREPSASSNQDGGNHNITSASHPDVEIPPHETSDRNDGKTSGTLKLSEESDSMTASSVGNETGSKPKSDWEIWNRNRKCEAVTSYYKSAGDEGRNTPTKPVTSLSDKIICLLYTSPSPRD